jgi:DNA-binding response OmpR family regulator
VWNRRSGECRRAARVRWLRAKLEEDPENPELIITARGMGYMFQRIVPGGLDSRAATMRGRF